MSRKILAIAAALMIGIAANSGAALARGGGGFGGGHMGGGLGGHIGGVGGIHLNAGLGGAHLGGIGTGFGVAHFGRAHIGGLSGHAMGLNDGGPLHSRFIHDHHARGGLYDVAPLYNTNDCDFPTHVIDSTVCNLDGE
jgi:hypothetical protein